MNLKAKQIVLALLYMVGMSAHAQFESANNVPRIQFEYETRDFGIVKNGAILEFPFLNVGNAPLIIKSVFSTLTYIDAWCIKDTVMPNEQGVVCVSIHGSFGNNRFNKSIVVRTNVGNYVLRAYLKVEYNEWKAQKNENGKIGYIDNNGNYVIPAIYDEVQDPLDSRISGGYNFGCIFYYWVNKNGKWGLIDTLNRTIIPFEYDGVQGSRFPDHCGMFIVKKKGKFGLIELNGRVHTPCIYDTIEPCGRYRLYCVKRGANYGVINHDGHIIIPFEYEEVIYTNGHWQGKKNGEWAELNIE